MINVLILAGASKKDRSEEFGTYLKSLADIDGEPMIKYVIDALKACEFIDKMAVVCPYDRLHTYLEPMIEHIIDSEDIIMNNVMNGVNCLGFEKPILVVTCDIPLLTPEAVSDFIKRAMDSGADFCYPIVEKSIMEEKFPGIKRTYSKFKEGTFSGGNIFFINPSVVRFCFKKAQELIDNRKEPIKMARVLGFKILTQYCLNDLTLSQVKKRFSKIFDINAEVIISEYPELANDVDTYEHLKYARKYLLKGAGNIEDY
jgi:GTP:adenosylcobinamide-phosphate guanylyltransferase